MKTTFQPARRNQSAMALIIVLGFLLASLLLFASFMYWTSSNATITTKNNQFVASQYAAEAATENVLSQMEHDFLCQSLTNAAYYSTLTIPQTSWPVQFTFSDTNGVANQISVSIGAVPGTTQPLDSQFSGLYGFPMACVVAATATPIGQTYNVPATVSQSVQFASIPVFQFAIFYNINLEIDPGQAMTISGPVFCNQSMWIGNANPTFNSRVSAVGTVTIAGNDPLCTGKSDSGSPTFLLAGQPTSGNDALTLPIGVGNTSSTTNPTNAEAILNLPPPAYATGTDPAYTTNGLVYNFNSCDIIISNAVTGTNGALGTNIVIYYQDAYNSSYLNKLTNNEVVTFSNRSAHTPHHRQFQFHSAAGHKLHPHRLQLPVVNECHFLRLPRTGNRASRPD